MTLKNTLPVFIIALFAMAFALGVVSSANAAWGSYGGSGSSSGTASSPSSSYSAPSSGSSSGSSSSSWSSYGGSGSTSGTCCTTPASTVSPEHSDSSGWSSYGGSASDTGTCCTTTSTYTPPTYTPGCTTNCGGGGGGGGGGGCTHNCNPPPRPAPTCDLSLDPSQVDYGDDVTISWSTQNASNVSLSGFGTVSTSGSRLDNNITQNKTYTLTATGNGKTVTCVETVTVKREHKKVLSCDMYVDDYDRYDYNYNYNQYSNYGRPVVIRWTSNNAVDGYITPTIGDVSPNGSRTVYPNRDTTYKGTFTSRDGEEVKCSVKVTVDRYTPPPVVYQNPPPYINLSAVPYTGLELGPVGTALYWSFLVLWCLGAAYLIAVKRAHMSIYRWYKKALFGEEVHTPAAEASEVSFAGFSQSDLTKLASMLRSAVAGPTHTAYAEHTAPQSDAADPFILSQIHRGQRS